MLDNLKKEVLKANLDLVKNGLVLFTWGNASAIDKKSGLVVIKPSGVEYESLTYKDMVVVDLNGKVVEGKYRPSSDTLTHLALYKERPEICGIVHTHSTYATAFAQADRPIPAYGTTHADYFNGQIPCARNLKIDEVDEYEKNTGIILSKAIKNSVAIPACLVAHHGVFAWGRSAGEAAFNATVVEEIAKLAYLTETLNKKAVQLPEYVAEKHYSRKHGKDAYYGQGDKK